MYKYIFYKNMNEKCDRLYVIFIIAVAFYNYNVHNKDSRDVFLQSKLNASHVE